MHYTGFLLIHFECIHISSGLVSTTYLPTYLLNQLLSFKRQVVRVEYTRQRGTCCCTYGHGRYYKPLYDSKILLTRNHTYSLN